MLYDKRKPSLKDKILRKAGEAEVWREQLEANDSEKLLKVKKRTAKKD